MSDGSGVAWPPPPPPPPSEVSMHGLRTRRAAARDGVIAMVRRGTPLTLLAVVTGVLFGGRVATEDARTAARAALGAGNPALAVRLDEQVSAGGGILQFLDPGAQAGAEHDAELARLAWALQLAGQGRVDAAVAVLDLVGEPSLRSQRQQLRGRILVDAASRAEAAGQPALAVARLDEALRGGPPVDQVGAIQAQRASDQVANAAELLAAGRAADAVATLDQASAWVTAASTAGARPPAPVVAALAQGYPSALLAAAREDASAGDLNAAAGLLQRVVTEFRGTPQSVVARRLLTAPQTVVGTLVSAAGTGAAGRVRLSTHFTQQPGGYLTSGPFYFGSSDRNGDFTIPSVPVGGPYVLEYLTGGNWMTLVDPRTDQPANPVTVSPLTPTDLNFVVLPG